MTFMRLRMLMPMARLLVFVVGLTMVMLSGVVRLVLMQMDMWTMIIRMTMKKSHPAVRSSIGI